MMHRGIYTFNAIEIKSRLKTQDLITFRHIVVCKWVGSIYVYFAAATEAIAPKSMLHDTATVFIEQPKSRPNRRKDYETKL